MLYSLSPGNYKGCDSRAAKQKTHKGQSREGRDVQSFQPFPGTPPSQVLQVLTSQKLSEPTVWDFYGGLITQA